MSEEDETLYVAMRVKDMPTPPIPCIKLVCSGGCGEEVWVDKNVERIWSKVPVLCMNCSVKAMDSSKEEVDLVIAPETIGTVKKFFKGHRHTRT